MRVVIQRTVSASVHIGQQQKASIGRGFLIFLGIEEADTEDDINWLCSKIARLRVFSDDEGLMNLDIEAVDGELLVVSQFTLHASTKKGNRPSYIRAARPETAIPLYEHFISRLELETNRKVQTGIFGEMMQVELINDGPVTILIDSRNKE